jgi:hypothetical protein
MKKQTNKKLATAVASYELFSPARSIPYRDFFSAVGLLHGYSVVSHQVASGRPKNRARNFA